MMKRLLMPVLAVGLGLGVLAVLPSRAAESIIPAEKINKLIQQLGSDAFEDRQQAEKDLDALGEPALDALKKAMASDDTEIRRRSEELIRKIEGRVESVKVLQPTKIHLAYNDMPLKDALADFSKKSGYNLTLHDPENKLKDRKVKLDTGDTVFWTAFDKFCAAASLTEAQLQDVLPQAPPPGAVPVPLPAVQIKPIRRIIQPLPAETPNEQDVTPAQPEQKQIEKQAVPENQLKRVGALQAVAQAQAQVAQPAVQPILQPAVIRPGVVFAQPLLLPPGQIILRDGKTPVQPTDYSSAIRVSRTDGNRDGKFTHPSGEWGVGLYVSPEPKIIWQQLISVNITKATDDQGQTLTQRATEAEPVLPNGPAALPGIQFQQLRVGLPGVVGANNVSLHQQFPIYLKRGAKNVKSLKELSGLINAIVLAPAKDVITTENLFKSANKTFNGGEKGWIKILDATRAENGQVRVRFEMQAPSDVVPGNGLNPAIGVPVPLPGGIQIQPALPQAFQVQAQAVQIQIQGQVAVGRIGRPGLVMGQGLRVVDDKGNNIPMTVQQQLVRDPNGARMEQVAIFQLPKEQETAKLVYSGSRSVTVQVPFTLKDVTLP